MSIGIIGAGRLAQALVKGVIKSGYAKPVELMASAHVQDVHHLEEMRRLGCQTTTVNTEVVKKSEVIIAAVKPQVLNVVLQEIASEISSKRLLISVAMGVTLARIQQALPDKTRVIRVMPNTPSLVMAGASVFSSGSYATSDDNKLTKELFSCIGICEEVPETYMDAVTALSGSGPAYIYMVIEALADGGVKMGLPRELSMKLAAQCVLGSAKMVLEEQRHPGSLKDDVASPGGSTIHALHLLEKAGIRAIFMSAVEEATKTAQKLAKELK